MSTADPEWVGHALASYAESWLGSKETTSNRGPEVDFFVASQVASQRGGRPGVRISLRSAVISCAVRALSSMTCALGVP